MKLLLLNPNRTTREVDMDTWVRAPDDERWARVALDEEHGVSTVFLGSAHHGGAFESLWNGGNDIVRYRTWWEAEAGHAEIVAMLTEGAG